MMRRDLLDRGSDPLADGDPRTLGAGCAWPIPAAQADGGRELPLEQLGLGSQALDPAHVVEALGFVEVGSELGETSAILGLARASSVGPPRLSSRVCSSSFRAERLRAERSGACGSAGI